MTDDAVVRVDGLVKCFGPVRAVGGLSMEVVRGQVHGFLGPNGAGKSTTIRVLLGLYRRNAGTVEVLGLDPQRHPREVTRQVGYVPGDVALWPNLTGREVLDAVAGIRGAYDAGREAELLDAFALDPRVKVRTYSKGNRQKVLLVAAFAARTELLILDEPTSGLDPLMEEVFQRTVREAVAAGRTVLLSSHILGEVERLCDVVTIVKDGALVESGRVDRMRHLAASRITGWIEPGDTPRVRAELAGIAATGGGIRVEGGGGDEGGVPDEGGVGDDGAVDVRVRAASTNAALAALLAADVRELSCTPSSLDDLFLRHYAPASR